MVFTTPWAAVRDIASGHLDTVPELETQYLGDRSEIPTVTLDAGYIPGAIAVPPDQLEVRLGEFVTDRDIVAYCRGPHCVYADLAVRMLTAAGRTACRLDDGYPRMATGAEAEQK